MIYLLSKRIVFWLCDCFGPLPRTGICPESPTSNRWLFESLQKINETHTLKLSLFQ